MRVSGWIFMCTLPLWGAAVEGKDIRVPRQPRVSPDGQSIAFAWQKDIWLASAEGGEADRLTLHPSDDSRPYFSPDGQSLAFMSNRSGSSQVYVVSLKGGTPKQITFDSQRKTLQGYTADGKSLLVSSGTDRSWTRSESVRLFAIDPEGKAPKRRVLDVGFSEASLSPDATKVLLTRGRASWTRKGYRGALATQLWLADLSTTPATMTRLDEDRPNFQNVSMMNPFWGPDGEGFYYTSDPDGTFDVYYRRLGENEAKRITQVGSTDRSDDGVAFASLSSDGKTLVFRRRFDLHRFDMRSGETDSLSLHTTGDSVASAKERRVETSANSIAFTDDGKQMAFVSGEDVYVMDRILKEPVRVTNDAFQESSLAFSRDGKRLYFVSDVSGEVDIWEATHEQEDNIWWLAESFKLRQVTEDRDVERSLRTSPGSDHIAFIKGTDLFVMDDDGDDHRVVAKMWSAPSFDWSPDGKWFVYATQDSDYNSDVWIRPLDGTREPFNISRHPDMDSSPVWSGDGKRVAFVSRRNGDEADIYYVNLTKQEEEKTSRDKKLEEALDAMKKKGGKGAAGPGGGASASERPRGRRGRGGRPESVDRVAFDEDAPEEKSEAVAEEKEEKKGVEVHIDFEGLLDRVHRISIPDSWENGLIFSPDGKKLAFNATVSGQSGFYTVEFPDVGAPSRLSNSGLSSARWLASTKEIVGLSRSGGGGGFRRGGFGFGGGSSSPAAMSARGEVTSFGFSVRRVKDWQRIREISFDQGWRAMRDRFYDENMNNRNWEAIRDKYRPVAAQCLGAAEFSELMNMMLGELNASHMGHRGGSDPLPESSNQGGWNPTTFHLGLRFADAGEGTGRVVESVIPGSPCHEARSEVRAGEIVMAIDGRELGPDVDLDRLLTMNDVRDVELVVADGEGNERTVTVRPTRSVQGLLYPEYVENTRKKVEELSSGTLGYLHIQGMNMRSFRQMEEDLYHAGHGKEGLIIDVRFNGGGSTTDHVLTALTQPVHAITRSRGSGEGYPQDRKIYASWSKPIVLMCNEYSFSNAEILSHAVKQIGRGRLVGMRTAGGVISTGSARLLDGSSVRMPTRGWYLVTTGEDMELNGCEPDIALWNEPGGEDRQLQVAVETLLEDVAKVKAEGRVQIEPAAEKRRRDAAGTTGTGESRR